MNTYLLVYNVDGKSSKATYFNDLNDCKHYAIKKMQECGLDSLGYQIHTINQEDLDLLAYSFDDIEDAESFYGGEDVWTTEDIEDYCEKGFDTTLVEYYSSEE